MSERRFVSKTATTREEERSNLWQSCGVRSEREGLRYTKKGFRMVVVELYAEVVCDLDGGRETVRVGGRESESTVGGASA